MVYAVCVEGFFSVSVRRCLIKTIAMRMITIKMLMSNANIFAMSIQASCSASSAFWRALEAFVWASCGFVAQRLMAFYRRIWLSRMFCVVFSVSEGKLGVRRRFFR